MMNTGAAVTPTTDIITATETTTTANAIVYDEILLAIMLPANQIQEYKEKKTNLLSKRFGRIKNIDEITDAMTMLDLKEILFPGDDRDSYFALRIVDKFNLKKTVATDSYFYDGGFCRNVLESIGKCLTDAKLDATDLHKYEYVFQLRERLCG